MHPAGTYGTEMSYGPLLDSEDAFTFLHSLIQDLKAVVFKGVIKVFWGFSKVSWGRILGAAAKTPKYFGG